MPEKVEAKRKKRDIRNGARPKPPTQKTPPTGKPGGKPPAKKN